MTSNPVLFVAEAIRNHKRVGAAMPSSPYGARSIISEVARRTTPTRIAGMALIVAGVGWLLLQ